MIAVAGFMTTLDNTVVTVAAPSIQTSLHVSLPTVEWFSTAYILTFSSVMLTGGRLADVFGRKRTFLIGVGVFTAASLLAGLSQNAELLVTARIVQGAGAALVLPAGLTLVSVGRTERETAVGSMVWIGASAAAVALGPLTGGWIVSHWDWGTIFLINVPPGVLVLVLGLLVVPESRDGTAGALDVPGLLASGTMLFAFTYAVMQVQTYGWTDPAVLSVLGLGVAALAVLILVERWAPDPLIDVVFFRAKAFSGGTAVMVLWGIGFNGVLFYASLFLQRVMAFSPTETGAVFLPPAIIIAVLMPAAFWLAKRTGARLTTAASLTFVAAGMAMFATLGPGDGMLQLLPGIVLLGIGSTLVMPLVMYVLKAVPEERTGVASGILSVAREVSGAFGIAIIGVIIQTRQRAEVAAGAGAVKAFQHATPYGLLAGAGLVLLGALIAAVTLPGRDPRPRRRVQPAPAPQLEHYGAYRGGA